VAVFLDGPHHADAQQQARDTAAGDRLDDLGWTVIRILYDEDWQAAVQRDAWLFGPGRTAAL
jgi:very-short-patch-repair endonuclease